MPKHGEPGWRLCSRGKHDGSTRAGKSLHHRAKLISIVGCKDQIGAICQIHGGRPERTPDPVLDQRRPDGGGIQRTGPRPRQRWSRGTGKRRHPEERLGQAATRDASNGTLLALMVLPL